MKIARKDNWRVELIVDRPWGAPNNDVGWLRSAEEVAAQVRRHVDGVERVMVRYDSHDECSFCGYEWETEPDTDEPACCGAAQAEFHARPTPTPVEGDDE